MDNPHFGKAAVKEDPSTLPTTISSRNPIFPRGYRTPGLSYCVASGTEAFYPLKEKYWNKKSSMEAIIDELGYIALDEDTLTTSSWNFSPRARGYHWPLYVRPSYKDLYDYCCRTCQKADVQGVVVLGSPGIGKSVYLLYALVRRLMEGLTTIFHPGTQAYIFDEEGVWVVTGVLTPDHLKLGDAMDFVMCLYDAGHLATPPPSHYSSGSCFLVHATSPRESVYKEWAKQAHAPFWFMDVWDECEFIEMRQKMDKFGIPFDKEKISRNLLERGPCPRDHTTPHDRVDFFRDVWAEILILVNNGHWERYATSVRSGRNQLLHKVFMIKASENHSTGQLVFKTLWIEVLVAKAYELSPSLRSRKLYNELLNISQAHILCGWIFERNAIVQTSMSDSDSSFTLFSEMIEMPHDISQNTGQKPSKVCLSDRLYTLQAAPWNLRHPFRRRTIKYLDSIKKFRLSDDNSNDHEDDIKGADEGIKGEDKANFSYKCIVKTNDDAGIVALIDSIIKASISNDEDSIISADAGSTVGINEIESFYFVPTNIRNPLFDAFFFELSGPKLIVWVLQMTISASKQTDSTQGYKLLQHVKDQVDGKQMDRKGRVKWEEVIFKYVFVMPDSHLDIDEGKMRPAQIINIRFPDDEDKAKWIQGSVYLLFLNMD